MEKILTALGSGLFLGTAFWISAKYIPSSWWYFNKVEWYKYFILFFMFGLMAKAMGIIER